MDKFDILYEDCINDIRNSQLIESLMPEINQIIKKHIDEVNIMGVEVKSVNQPLMSDLTDIDDDIPQEDKQISVTIQKILTDMFVGKYGWFLKQNGLQKDIEWSYIVETACTDGKTGRLVMNPKYMRHVYDRFGDAGVQFIVLHETMHNYYTRIHRGQEIKTPTDNIIVDKMINREIISRWAEFKDIIKGLGALL